MRKKRWTTEGRTKWSREGATPLMVRRRKAALWGKGVKSLTFLRKEEAPRRDWQRGFCPWALSLTKWETDSGVNSPPNGRKKESIT